MLTIGPLGSGSRGNALVLSADDESIVIDVGFSRREMLTRLRAHGLRAETLRAALITHEHTDHTCGCRIFCDELHIPACMTPGTTRMLKRRGALPERVREFSPGMTFSVGRFQIRSFPVPHDAEEPVGFVVERDGMRVGVATDLGEIDSAVGAALRDCDALILESNYDPDMLAQSDRALRLKRRIAGRRGHLDNLAAADALPLLATERTKLVLFAHMSAECNLPELVAGETAKPLAGKNLRWEIISQCGDTPCFKL